MPPTGLQWPQPDDGKTPTHLFPPRQESWRQSQGDKAKAADYFRKTREKGITMYIEHVGAGAELKQLGLQAN